MRNISEIPERWVILKMPDNLYKVFAIWSGGYLRQDRWKLNSGIEKAEQDEDFYYFIGFSGSCYKCNKKGYGVMTSYGQNILDKILKTGKEAKVKVELIEDREDWVNLL